ncbi:DUF1428 domain-containing protein [Roseicitreum antarcticum]|uniref:Uncharacterized conserved protein YbaA, DUF1428 family n=1 Tax=Roseicitreum antarcticum TaxID=564137 RepID=A0A1H2YU03_9RHOB|nr:DUF1428 domain-containing protein [Roseicitreum antarcticum]SDX08059.1 Uncharacterized conserved protein YbaA, DUF1428 family [Roseicitreum antarcticum]
MAYFSGSVGAVPAAKKQEYIEHLNEAWQLFRTYGATRMIETWGVDVPRGEVTDFYAAVDARENEVITFSWIEWPDKATCDAAWRKMPEDPAIHQMAEIPGDGSRMIFGGFTPIYRVGAPCGAGYYQGFLLAVTEENKEAYIAMAAEGWQIFQKGGAFGMIETWGEDVPHGKKTDFYRATKALAGEVPVFSWTAWPDRATCDAATRAMEEAMADVDMATMPFDAMRMMWAGFAPLFDSASAPD